MEFFMGERVDFLDEDGKVSDHFDRRKRRRDARETV